MPEGPQGPEPSEEVPCAEKGAGCSDLCRFIRDNHDRILQTWEQAVRALPAARGLSHVRLLDHVPDLLVRLADSLSDVAQGQPPRSLQSMPDEHALDRLDAGFDLKEVVQEYAILRSTIERLWEADDPGKVNRKEIVALDSAIDHAVAASVERYTRARDRTLVALDRISAAAFSESTNLEQFLPLLLQVLMETTETVDTAVILLREGELLRVRGAVGLEGASMQNATLRLGEGFAGRIAAEATPLEIRIASSDPLTQGTPVAALAIRALYGVPLLKANEVIGVAHIGSSSAYQFSVEDKILFRTMANRATAVIVQAQLVAREQASRKESEGTLALLNTLTAASPVGIAFIDPDLRYLRINAALADINGRPVEAHLGRTLREVLPDVAEALEPLLRKVIETGVPLTNVEIAAAPPSTPDRVRHWLANWYPVKAPGGPVLGVGTLVFEVTEQKQAEHALREREEWFRTLADNIPQLAWMSNERGEVHWYNQRWFDYTGTTAEQMKTGGWKQVQHPDHAHRVIDKMSSSVARGQDWEDTFPLRGKDGQYRWFLSRAIAIRDEAGQIVRWLGTNTDITEIKQAEDALARTADFRDRMMSILGHDLRNPLAAISTSTQMLFKAEDLNPMQGRAVARIAKSADRAMRLISDILDFARGRLGGGIPVEAERIHFGEVAQHAVEELQVAHPDHVLEFSMTGDTWGEWDSDRLSQVVGNLVANAVQHGRFDTSIQVSVVGDDREVSLEVTNQGTPIAKELVPTLFEPFSRGAGKSLNRSLGLGLFIVKAIVDAHGGTINVRSEDGKGTTFRMTLPRTRR